MIKLLHFILPFLLLVVCGNLINTIAQTQRNPVIEFSTGTWCQWCPCGDYTIENLHSTYPNLIPIAYHGPVGYDPFANFPGNEIMSLMGFTAYPIATADRVSATGDYTTWPGKVYSRINVPATVFICIQRNFNEISRQLNATSGNNTEYSYKVFLKVISTY